LLHHHAIPSVYRGESSTLSVVAMSAAYREDLDVVDVYLGLDDSSDRDAYIQHLPWCRAARLSLLDGQDVDACPPAAAVPSLTAAGQQLSQWRELATRPVVVVHVHCHVVVARWSVVVDHQWTAAWWLCNDDIYTG